MTLFIPLSENNGGPTWHVAVARIRNFHGDARGGTQIYFDVGQAIGVKETPEAVLRLIKEAEESKISGREPAPPVEIIIQERRGRSEL